MFKDLSINEYFGTEKFKDFYIKLNNDNHNNTIDIRNGDILTMKPEQETYYSLKSGTCEKWIATNKEIESLHITRKQREQDSNRRSSCGNFNFDARYCWYGTL